MALSYYSNNWADSFQHQMDFDAAIYADDPELQALLHGGAWNSDSFYDPNANDLFFSDQNSLLMNHDFTNGLVPLHNNLNSFEPFYYCPPNPKRQKCDQVYSSYLPPIPLQDYSPPPFLDFPAASYSNGSCERAPPASLSAQSAAARQRRRRITEKTQELGKLVPGGQKMNTAEMLQSAYKYIKFLQAQVALLEFVASDNQEVAEVPLEGEEMLQILLESPLIQEKLYSTENVLVPHKFVDGKTALEKRQ